MPLRRLAPTYVAFAMIAAAPVHAQDAGAGDETGASESQGPDDEGAPPDEGQAPDDEAAPSEGQAPDDEGPRSGDGTSTDAAASPGDESQDAGASQAPSPTAASNEATGAAPGSASSAAQPTSGATGSAPSAQTRQAPPATQRRHPAPPRRRQPPPQEQDEDEDEDEDDPRELDFLWIEGNFGYSYVDLTQFKQSNFLPAVEKTQENGYVAGAAAGFKVQFLTIGGRVSFASYPGFDLGTAGLDIGFRIALATLEPYIRAGLGYGWVGDANYDDPDLSNTDVYGLVADAGAGLDVYLGDYVSLGAGLDAAFLNLTRQKCNEKLSECDVSSVDVNVDEEGDAVGFQLRLHAHATLHL